MVGNRLRLKYNSDSDWLFFHPIRRSFSDQWDAAWYLQICVSSLTFLISSICERFSALFGSEISESGASVNRKFILRYFCCIYTSKSSKFGMKCSQKHVYKTTALARFPNSRAESRRTQLFTRKRFWHLWRSLNDSDTGLIFQYDNFSAGQCLERSLSLKTSLHG